MKTALIKHSYVVYVTAFLLLLSGCHDEPVHEGEEEGLTTSARGISGHLMQTKTFTSHVAIQWMDMQLQLMRQTTIIGNAAFSRHYAYSGIALYESVVPGMPAHQSIAAQLNGLSGLPKTSPGLAYYWPASANAALAYMNKNMFPNATDAAKAAIDALEATLHAQYSNQVDPIVVSRSAEFGRAVAEKIFQWSETDGYEHVNDAYTPSLVGPEYWTPPNPLPVHTLQYLGSVRLLVTESGENAYPDAPDYSALPAMTMEVINSKPSTTEDNYQTIF